MLCRSLFPLAGIIILKRLVDLLTGTPSVDFPVRLLILYISLVSLLLLLDDLFSIAGRYYAKVQSGRLGLHIMGMIHSHSMKLGLSSFEDPHFHELLGRASGDAAWRPASVVSDMVLMLKGILSFIAMAIILSQFSILILVIILVSFIPAYAARGISSRNMYRSRPEQAHFTRKWQYFSWLLTAERPAREVKLFQLGEFFDSLFRSHYTRATEVELNAIRKGHRIEYVAALFKTLIFAGIIIFFSLSLIRGHITAGELAMYLVAFRQAVVYLRDSVAGLSGLGEDRLFLRDLFDFLDRKEEITAKEPVTDPPEFSGDIEISDLTFYYPGSNIPALKDINLKIGKGEKIAIVGPNGSGKTTLVKLLCRLYDPATGEIRYSGVPVVNIDPLKYRRCFSVVFQDFMLYYLSVRENIGLGDLSRDPGDERLRQIFSGAGFDLFTDSLKNGFDTQLGHLDEEGRELSWGEWQKIAIIRALFREAPVLILDEPSSSLDSESEYAVISHLDDITAGRTTVLISHRLSNVAGADRIVVMDHGTVAECGTHEELMKRGGLYSSMYTKQKNLYYQ